MTGNPAVAQGEAKGGNWGYWLLPPCSLVPAWEHSEGQRSGDPREAEGRDYVRTLEHGDQLNLSVGWAAHVGHALLHAHI